MVGVRCWLSSPIRRRLKLEMPSNPAQQRLRSQQSGVRSQLTGAREFRRLLKQLPSSAKEEMADVLAAAGPRILAAISADTPVRSGALKAALKQKLLRSSLRLRVGLITKKANRDLFYARIVEFGRKAQTVTIRRGARAGALMRVRALAPRPFIYAKRPALRGALSAALRSFWDGTLQRAATGGFDE